jgi:hypothetical protein
MKLRASLTRWGLVLLGELALEPIGGLGEPVVLAVGTDERDRTPAAHRRMVVELVPEVPPLRMSAELLVRQPDRPVVRPPRVLVGEGEGLAGVSPPLADGFGRRSLVSPSMDPRELGRLGEDPVGGQYEARDVLRNVRARWGAGVVVAVQEPFGGHRIHCPPGSFRCASSRIKPVTDRQLRLLEAAASRQIEDDEDVDAAVTADQQGIGSAADLVAVDQRPDGDGSMSSSASREKARRAAR